MALTVGDILPHNSSLDDLIPVTSAAPTLGSRGLRAWISPSHYVIWFPASEPQNENITKTKGKMFFSGVPGELVKLVSAHYLKLKVGCISVEEPGWATLQQDRM